VTPQPVAGGLRPTTVDTADRRLPRALAVLLAAAALVVWPSTAALGSCAGPPSPSPHVFTGTVVDTEAAGRVATVVTDDGETVTVTGAEDPGSVTSVDRRYAVGGRYEFHPLNGEAPYRDNACTATGQLSGPTVVTDTTSTGFLPGWMPVDEQAGLAGLALFLGPLLAVGLVVVGLVVRARRHP
jgi:hypothetical protein